MLVNCSMTKTASLKTQNSNDKSKSTDSASQTKSLNAILYHKLKLKDSTPKKNLSQNLNSEASDKLFKDIRFKSTSSSFNKNTETSLLTSLSSFSLISSFNNSNENSKAKSLISSSTQTNTLMNTKSTDDTSNIWSKLFNQERDNICREKALKRESKALNQKIIKRGERVYGGASSWIKKWGYGPVAYLIDFLDPIFFDDIVTDFKLIFGETMDLPRKDNEVCKDVFDLRKLDPTGTITDLKKLNSNYVKEIYENSLNMCQIDIAMREWGWFMIQGQETNKQFVLEFDLNRDGRLSYREFFLGLIIHHSGKNLLCHNCLLLLKKKLSALFNYFDCTGEKYITAEQIWKFLPQINRDGETKWNIFGIQNNNNIRTDCVNDFVIKNGLSRPGFISKDEFVTGILLAYWDRQTTNTAIIGNNSRNLKKLRWNEEGLVDTVAWEYIKDKELAEKIAEAERQNERNIMASYKE